MEQCVLGKVYTHPFSLENAKVFLHFIKTSLFTLAFLDRVFLSTPIRFRLKTQKSFSALPPVYRYLMKTVTPKKELFENDRRQIRKSSAFRCLHKLEYESDTFKNLHFGECFQRFAFFVTVFIGRN